MKQLNILEVKKNTEYSIQEEYSVFIRKILKSILADRKTRSFFDLSVNK